MPRKGALPYSTFVEVVWEDAASNDGWVSHTDDTTPEIIVSRGWMIKDEEKYITIASAIHKSSKDEIGSTQTIPRGMIVSFNQLKVSHASKQLRRKVHSEPGAEKLHREQSKG